MADIQEREQDPVLVALTSLSDVAASSATDLADLNQDLAQIREHRIRGWSWRQIISDVDSPNPLAVLTKIATNLARASGGFRRALAMGLRREGMQVTEIAGLFEVSRQRVSALIRPRASSDDAVASTDDMDEQAS
jgi:hypothetical protein